MLKTKTGAKANPDYFDTLCEYSVKAANEWLSANAQDKAKPTPTEIKVAREVANFEVYDIEPSQWVLDWLEDPANELEDLSDLTFCLLASRLPDNE